VAQLIPIPFLGVTVILLVRARFRSDLRQEVLFKPVSTLLVIAVALLSLLSAGMRPSFTGLVTLGLVLSLGGDVALMFRTNRWFLIGLVLFLLAHVVYAVTFTVPNGFHSFHSQDLIVAAGLLVFGGAVYAYLWPGLGSMKVPVLAYVLVILFMVNRAISAFFGATFSPTQAWLLSVGAILFMLSDLLLAVNRFRRPFKAEPLGLFLYYGGQLLIALSPAYFSQA
jgi:uncharacterized membrane protein YhhN